MTTKFSGGVEYCALEACEHWDRGQCDKTGDHVGYHHMCAICRVSMPALLKRLSAKPVENAK